MIENTAGHDDLNETNSSENLQHSKHTTSTQSEQQDPTASAEDIENANKPQPNVILNKIPSGGHISTAHRDTERVAARANEASDSTDTNTGGIVAGAAKGASQS